MKSVDELIEAANSAMAEGDKFKAKSLLETAIAGFSNHKGLYHDAVNILLAGKMFDEAIALFERYKKTFGEELRADFTLNDIRSEKLQHEKAAQAYEGSTVKLFRRMSFWERGRFSNLPTFRPIKEIAISKDGVTFLVGSQRKSYRWDEVLDAFTTKREGYKGYYFGEDIVRTANIQTKDRIYKFDVSIKFPDFKDTDLLMRELGRYLTIRELPIS